MSFYIKQYLLPIIFVIATLSLAAKQIPVTTFKVTMENPATHYYHITMKYTDAKADKVDFKMCAWTPGYYQILDFAKAVENFNASDAKGKKLSWQKTSNNNWTVNNYNHLPITVSYDVKATISFVGNVYLDEHRAYITPGGLFMYVEKALSKPLTVEIVPWKEWHNIVATGLDSVKGKSNTFYAANFDVLYDSPFLAGELEQLPSFTVRGIPHYFIGYQLGEFDRQQFMNDIEKIVRSGIAVIGDIPYTHYTFLAIGPGRGGIEHLNSTSLSFGGGKGLKNPEARKGLYNFIAHEYFHHYNVKRIRPVELGPFDYSKENRTNMLWVSEGFTVYYEYLVTRRAGLTNDEDVLNAFTKNIREYENKPGHLYQSATQASYDTWNDGPFGRTGDRINKTISYYDKGPVLGLMLDFSIRHTTKNKQSLDDVMRLLYKKYYQQLKRGFTEKEFQQECEKIAGISLQEIFDDAATVKAIDYPKYFAYAGLSIDTATKELPGTYLGFTLRERDGIASIASVDWNSPAWNGDLVQDEKVLSIDGKAADAALLKELLATKKTGDKLVLEVEKDSVKKEIELTVGTKSEKSFDIKPMADTDELQKAIYKSWLQEKSFN